MRFLGIASLLDDVVCGNDRGIIPKPSPHCAMQICKRLDQKNKPEHRQSSTYA
ncbi:hypothetical protein TELCIR_18494 [Teladorsagia circumcincta]|uniref:Uncharacterized protein n=1 Tax=Teladorsagia circumcincta TaxID=45464 RepID=A0A2G9TPV3_TELCI|nr:hypothetical protein TELCIR_18494 [Teladorsagia circumcincta]